MKSYDDWQDQELALAAQRGDSLAENALVKRYAPLAEGIARSYFIAGGDEDDLGQIALIALLSAVRSFNPDKGAEFKTYASACMRNRLTDAVRSSLAGKNSALNDSVRIDDLAEDEDGFSRDDIRSPELTPEQQYIARESEEAFFEALSTVLGETDVEIIKLYLACVPYKEISEKLGVSAKKVDNTLYSVKKKLAKIVGTLKNS